MKVVSFMYKQRKGNTNISIHVTKGISGMLVEIKSFNKYFCSYFFKGYFTQKTTVIRTILNLEKLKRHIWCVDLEKYFNKYLYRYYFFLKKDHCVKCVQIRSFFWYVFLRIRTEYGDILRISPYSVRMRENADQKNSVFGRFSRSAYFSNENQLMK